MNICDNLWTTVSVKSSGLNLTEWPFLHFAKDWVILWIYYRFVWAWALIHLSHGMGVRWCQMVSACVSYSDDRPGFETDALVEQPGIAPTAPEGVDPAIDGVLKLCHKSPGVGPAILKRPFLSSSASMSFRSFRSFRSYQSSAPHLFNAERVPSRASWYFSQVFQMELSLTFVTPGVHSGSMGIALASLPQIPRSNSQDIPRNNLTSLDWPRQCGKN